jgi:hypothetical protein
MDPLLAGTAIHGFDAVVATGNKLLRAAKVRASSSVGLTPLIYARYLGSGGPRDCTEQNPRGTPFRSHSVQARPTCGVP